jgi:hypothetical protein
VLALLASIGWCLHGGPSWSWDRAHYHEYAGYAWLKGRFGDGLLPNGRQALLNSLGYVPRAILNAAGWGEREIAMAVSAVQGLAVWFVWRIARDRSPTASVHILAALIAFSTPVFLSQLGSSYLDVLTGVGVLAGVWACRRAPESGRATLGWIALGGLALGAATGLKLSNAIPAALAPILFLAPPCRTGGAYRWARALEMPIVYAAGGAAGMLLVWGGWGLALWRRYANPFFPMFDGLFNSAPAVTTQATTIETSSLTTRLAGLVQVSGGRFVPQDAGEWLSYPWRVADPTLPANLAYLEWHAPDPRLAVAVVLAFALGAMYAFGWIQSARRGAARSTPPATVDRRLLLFVLIWSVLWIASSANGRYGVALLMLASVPVVQMAHDVFPAGPVRRAALAALVVVHATWALVMPERADQPAGNGWDTAALRADVPDVLRESASLHVVTSTLSWSYLLPRFADGSTILHLPSMCRGDGCASDLGLDRARSLMDSWRHRTRTLVVADRNERDLAWLSDELRVAVDRQLAELDLRIAPSDCLPFEVSPIFSDSMMVEKTESGEQLTQSRFAVSCAVVDDPEAGARTRASRDRYNVLFDLLERTCPAELGGSAAPTHSARDGSWIRYFLGRDIWIQILDGRVAAKRLRRSTHYLGSIDEVLAGWSSERCSLLTWPSDDRTARRSEAPVFLR